MSQKVLHMYKWIAAATPSVVLEGLLERRKSKERRSRGAAALLLLLGPYHPRESTAQHFSGESRQRRKHVASK